MSATDLERIEYQLDNAVLHATAKNDWAEGYWIGRAIEHADQNAIGHDWLKKAFEERGLDVAVIAEPKPGDVEARWN